MTRYAASYMPAAAPLPMARQDFGEVPAQGVSSQSASRSDQLWRLAAFAPAIMVAFALSAGIAQWFAKGGVSLAEAMVVALVGVTFVWISLSVSTVTLGLVRRSIGTRPTRHAHPRGGAQNVALLVPVYNETAWEVFGNATAMIKELAAGPKTDRFSLFILSDTQDPEIAEQEERAYWALRAACPAGIEAYYRRRDKNNDKKVGNLTDWIETWGADYEAMVVLDADSLMSGAAIRSLADELAADSEAGLIQSFPSLIGSETLFGRMQQFSNAVYGWLLAEGLTTWAQREGNYWGHNAIIRTRAFAQSARLPYLNGRRGRRDLILSHDFVEAGMLRRAGWAVRFLPRTGGSYEETPQTLIAYALRDRRWCQGNLQHLRLLAARGFHPVSRFHLLQGAVAFLLSPAWFALIVIWSMLGSAMPEEAVAYFNPANPLQPMWPATTQINGLIYLGFIYTMLLMPKLTGTLALGFRSRTRRAYGGWWRLLSTALFEIVCSILYAPVMMVQQTIAVVFAVLGRSGKWTPQRRDATGYSWRQTLRFHWIETAVGGVMISQIALGAASYWLLPIAVSLVLAVPLSRMSALRVSDRALGPIRLDSPQTLNEPQIVRAARAERAWMKAVLAEPVARKAIAAE
ncbi:glucans biosynthesis glucosyltransferase MdoH [Shimia abyssi]|uniref:Glucans biosynthesis glucosyltransferase H n=1 Tax=Shimia abyssi TaxID=1662395 RepID=A0A2P8FBE6_9RHOB|nr:glucans biosynthesis glucosyltransferase MdoH [Shimia abyssi]PSL19065.1 membrane glycosyltransferase [Shimia abyssi]